jgi:hypothetical protein
MEDMTTSLRLLAVGVFALTLAATSAPAPEPTVEPAVAPVYPAALVCVEAPGTSEARPCEPWCKRQWASHVLRLMQVEHANGVVEYRWTENTCGEYLAERSDA